tara:strand:+ start:488 stop:964 length:477 start_codon:yes stop_codon:yes gene_type:complete
MIRKNPAIRLGYKPELLEEHEEDCVALEKKAFELLEKNKWEEAIKAWSRLKEKLKNIEWADFYIALCQTRLGQIEEAEDIFDILINESKNKAVVYGSHSMRAELLLDNDGDLDNALDDIEKSIEIMKEYEPPEDVEKDLQEARKLREEILLRIKQKDN